MYEKQISSQLSAESLKFRSNFRFFQKKDEPHGPSFPEIIDPE